MNELLKEFLSYILVESAASDAKKAGYIHIPKSRGYWSKSGDWPAEATTRGKKFRLLTTKEKKDLAKAAKEPAPAKPEKIDRGLAVVRQAEKDRADAERAVRQRGIKPSATGKQKQRRPAPGKITVNDPVGALNTNAESLSTLIKNGFKSPGNDFSKYSESVSIVIAKSLVDDPDSNDQKTMERIIRLDCDSATLTRKVGVKSIPAHLKKRYEALKDTRVKDTRVFDTCPASDDQNKARFMTMIAAEKKAERMARAIKRSGLPSVSVDSFSGDAESKQRLFASIEGLPEGAKIYTETGEVLTKDEALERVKGFGTAKFPADTVLLGKDPSGNMILCGFSDKKDLKAIINNGSVTAEMRETVAVLDRLLQDKKISPEEHARLTGVLQEQQSIYEAAEERLTETVVEPAKLLSEASDEQLTDLVAKAKTVSGSTRNPAKYWRRVSKFQEQATKKATEANKTEYLQWLHKAGWDGQSEVSEELAMKAWALKCKDTFERGEDLAKDDQELLFRLELVPKEQIVEQVSVIRQEAMKCLETIRNELDKTSVDGTPLGTYMDGVRAWHALHLDMREHKGSLSMVAGDTVVDYESIEGCLGGVSSKQEFTSRLQVATRNITSKEYGVVTGASVEVYSLGADKERRSIGVRDIRSKDGILGKLQTTWTFHPDFQDCLESKKSK